MLQDGCPCCWVWLQPLLWRVWEWGVVGFVMFMIERQVTGGCVACCSRNAAVAVGSFFFQWVFLPDGLDCSLHCEIVWMCVCVPWITQSMPGTKGTDSPPNPVGMSHTLLQPSAALGFSRSNLCWCALCNAVGCCAALDSAPGLACLGGRCRVLTLKLSSYRCL